MAKQNFIDKTIAAISPEKALKRATARQRLEFINSGYSNHGANRSKTTLRGWNSTSRSPKEDIHDNLHLLRERSRDLYMGGAAIATGAIKTVRTNVIGAGLVLKPSIDPVFLKMDEETAEDWKKTVVREFEYWAKSENCDILRKNNFYEQQQLAFLSMMVSGDVLSLLPHRKRRDAIYDLKVQLIEGDRLGTPPDKIWDDNVTHGVEIKKGEITAYYIFNRHPGAYNFDGKYTRIPAYGKVTGRRNVIHLMESERPEQVRGVPMLAPVIEPLRQLGQYSNAELTAAVVGGMFTVFVKTEMPEVGMGESFSVGDLIDPNDEYSYELGYGTVANLGLGEDISVASPGRPNVAFDGFVNSILRQIGSALEVPYELLIKHFSASYSASRAALLEAWKMFRMRRSWMANKFCQPIYEEWLAEAVAKGRINAPGFFEDPIVRAAYCKAEWHGPSQGQIDPLKEVNAAVVRIENNLSTGEKEAAELTGTDYSDNVHQRAREQNRAMVLSGGGEKSDE